MPKSMSSEFLEISDDDPVGSHKEPSSVHGCVNLGKRKSELPGKVEWTDDESDNVYANFKKRKTGKRKSTSKGKGKQKAKGGKAAERRESGKTQREYENEFGDLVNSEDDLPENELPEYLRKRRREFNRNKEILLESGLRLPPDYSDIYFSDDENLPQLEERPKFDSSIKPSREYKDVSMELSAGVIPASIAQYLRDYQIDGVKFLHCLFVYQEGGILGDDMGLGKTVQVAAFLTAAFGKTGDKRDGKRMRKIRRGTDRWYPRALIVCPGSLSINWKNELNRWGWWNIDFFHGPGKDDVLQAVKSGRLEIMITTYATYRDQREKINMVEWDVVVADECHTLKERTSQIARAMNEVNALCRIGLTGTAIQNKYEEFWTLLNWTNPGHFGTLGEWVDTICKPLTVGQSHNATVQQLSLARKTAKKLVENLLPPVFRRRVKSLIAHQLPKKTDRVVFCPLSEQQRSAYESFLDSKIVEFVRLSTETCDCGSKRKRGWCCYADRNGTSWKTYVFPIIMTLQKLSNHLFLIIPQTGAIMDEKYDRELEFLRSALPHTWEKLYAGRDALTNLANAEFCGKWKVLKKLLRFWHSNGDKVLVFSHSVKLLRILQQLFSRTSYSVSYLDGTLNYEDRQKTVDDFNSDPGQFVFLISTKAGGVGLNITSANKVVVMDPHWNPSYDLQAQDRAYRIGQTRDVEVFRLISAGTIEEITYARQIYKQQQANIGYNASNERRYFQGVQQDSQRQGEIFGIRNLLTYRGDQIMLRDIVNKTNIAEAKAGVHLVDINMDESIKDSEELSLIKKEESADDESGGLGHLAAFLTSGGDTTTLGRTKSQNPKADAIQAILSSAGVEYTHENSEVIGSSKVEDRLSRKAEQYIDTMNSEDSHGTRTLFAGSQEMDMGRIEEPVEYKYNPPEEVMTRQFCTMAQTFGFSSATEFALVVESMSQKERSNCLDLFYKKRAAKLKERDPDLADETSDDTPALTEVKTEDDKLTESTTFNTMEVRIKQEIPFSASAADDVKVKDEPDETPPKGLAGNAKTSIWLSDDDETDEL